MEATRFKGDLPEHVYRFSNGTCLYVKYRSTGDGWKGNGWVRIGYHFEHYRYALVLQRKVDELLIQSGSAHMNLAGPSGSWS